MTVINKKTGEKVVFILLVLQVAYLIVLNLCRTRYLVDFDSGAYIIQAMEIWKQKSLRLDGFYYTTQKMWDSPLFLVVLLYGITKDVFRAVGIANSIYIVALLGIVRKLCKDIDLSIFARRVTLLAIFTVYQYGVTDYADELYINAAWYGVRILVMFILLDVMVCVHKKIIGIQEYILYSLALFILFLSGMSTGIFSIGCCVFPILFYEFLETFRHSKTIAEFWKQNILLPFGAIVVPVMGIVCNRMLGFQVTAAESKNLVIAKELWSNLLNCIAGYFQLLGWPADELSLLSFSGLVALASFFIAALMLLVILYNFIKYVKAIFQGKTVLPIRGMLANIFLINILLFSLVKLNYTADLFEYRYWLVILIPSFLLLGLEIDESGKLGNYSKLLCFAIVVCMACISLFKDFHLWCKNNNADTYQQVMDEVASENLDVLYVYGEYFSTRVLVTFADPRTETVALYEDSISDDGIDWIYDTLRMQRWGSYAKYDGDCMELSGKIGILCDGSKPEQDEFYIKHATSVKKLQNYTLCVLDVNCVDCKYGVPENGQKISRDFLNHGYELNGVTFEDGQIKMDSYEDADICGRFTAKETGIYCATLNYSAESVIGDDNYFQIIVTNENGSRTEYRKNIDAENASVSLTDIRLTMGDTYEVNVVKASGLQIVIDNIVYESE